MSNSEAVEFAGARRFGKTAAGAYRRELVAERERSAVEARRLQGVDLVMHDVARYDRPSADTIYALEYAYHLLPDVAGKEVLDYGCGDGLNSVGLLRRGANVTALDLSPDLLRICEQRVWRNLPHDAHALVDRFWSIEADAHCTGLPSESYDVVFGTAILHHLNLERALKEVHRLLRPGGCAIFKEPMRSSKLIRAIRAAIPYVTPETSPDEYPLRHDDLIAAIHKAGFEGDLQWKDFLLPSTNVIETFLPRFARASYKLDAWLLQRFRFLRFYASQRVMLLQK